MTFSATSSPVWLESDQHSFAVTGQSGLKGVARLVKREPDLFAFGSERGGDARSRLAHRFGEMDRGRREFLRKRFARAKERRPRVVGIDDDGLAFARQFVDEQPNAPLIVGVGAFEVGDLGAHDHFKLAGARQRALDAVAHGGGFTSNRL